MTIELAAVPGAIGVKPTPKNVAMLLAKSFIV